jgi:hypothetical protein
VGLIRKRKQVKTSPPPLPGVTGVHGIFRRRILRGGSFVSSWRKRKLDWSNLEMCPTFHYSNRCLCSCKTGNIAACNRPRLLVLPYVRKLHVRSHFKRLQWNGCALGMELSFLRVGGCRWEQNPTDKPPSHLQKKFAMRSQNLLVAHLRNFSPILKPDVHYRVHKTQPLVQILIQAILVHILFGPNFEPADSSPYIIWSKFWASWF